MALLSPISRQAAAPAVASPPALRVLAVGSLSADARELRAPAAFPARGDIVEHRIARWPGRGWVAEVRVNLVLLHRSLFSQPTGYDDALEWCNAVAPLATRVQSPPRVDVAATLAENARVRAASHAEAAATATAFGLTRND